VSVRTSTHKLIKRADPTAADHYSELYDLVADPRELHNLYGNSSYAAVQATLQEKLFSWLMLTSDVTPWKIDDRNGGKWPKVAAASTAKPNIGKPTDVSVDSAFQAAAEPPMKWLDYTA